MTVDIRLGAHTLELSRQVDPSMSSARTFDLISSWLARCNLKEHPNCHRTIADSLERLPTRLLHVRTPGHVQLVPTKDMSLDTRWTTLSHCWGDVRPLCLTKCTLPTLCISFSDEKLPQTFRDAANITRRLGVDYLWIDSLCIFQDSPLDWKVEAKTMGQVYSGSFCNIAATAAHDSLEGCFSNRAHDLVTPHTFNSKQLSLLGDAPTGPPGFIIPEQYFVYPGNFWRRGMTNQPLLKRGWVVQERLLAPRTIHFSNPQVFWECSHVVACETFPIRLPDSTLADTSQTWRLSITEINLLWRL